MTTSAPRFVLFLLRTCAFAAAPLLGPAAASGQQIADPTDPTACELLVPIHTAEADVGVPYGIWGAGSTYKASFHAGATFVPLLGTAFPHNLPFAWRTSSVRAGTEELVVQEPQLTWTATRAEYDLGLVVEAYDLRRDGLEQTFVLRGAPGGSGGLEIRGAITTPLHADAVGDAHQALRFCDDQGRHIVTYGAATAIDARGRRMAMTTRFADGEVVLRLDGAWLATAAFPVVVDPLLGTGDVVTGAQRTEVDVVQQSLSVGQSIWIAFVVAASLVDKDVYVYRWSQGGMLGGQAYYDVTSSWSTSGVQCAIADVVDRAVVVFDRQFSGSQARSVRFHAHDVNDLTANTSFGTIAATDNAWRPDVSGIFLNPVMPVQALVVWQQEPNGGGAFAETNGSDIWGCYVDLVAGSASAPFAIAATALNDHERPSVNPRSAGDIDGFRVAYQVYNTLGVNDDWDVAVRAVDTQGNVSAAVLLDDASPDHKMAPVIAGHTGRHLVAFTSSTLAQQPGKPAGRNGHQIRVVRLDWSVSHPLGVEPFGTVVLQSNNDPRLELAGLGFDNVTESHWALMFRSNVSETLYLRTVGHRGQQLQAETVFDPVGSVASVGGGVGFSENYRQFCLAYAANGMPANYVTFDRFDYPAVQPWGTTGPGCSAATIQWQGGQLIGSYFTRVRVNGAPPNAIHLLVMATEPAQGLLTGIPLFTNGCWLLVPNVGPDHLGILFDVGSSASWLLPLPEFLGSDTFYFQDFHTDASGNFVLVSTQRLEVPIVK